MPILLRRLLPLLLLTALPASGWGLEILYPPDKAVITRSDYLIVRGGDTPLDGVVVEIKDYRSELLEVGSDEYRAAFSDFLILAPVFDAGQNSIKVEGYAGGKVVATQSADIFFEASPLDPAPAGYKKVAVHTPAQEAVCAPCHQMNPDAKALASESPKVNPCAACHLRMLDVSNVHGPAGVWQCSYCHQADSQPGRYQARPGDAEVCTECHEDKVQEFKANKFVHGPIEAGMCLVCHDPHASNNPAQLVAPVNELCLRCHEEIGKKNHIVRGVGGKAHPLQGPENPAFPGKPFNCASCHDPHGGASEQYFQRGLDNRFALCQLCHKK
jgi:predicted CXXCH cytochrome family protein